MLNYKVDESIDIKSLEKLRINTLNMCGVKRFASTSFLNSRTAYLENYLLTEKADIFCFQEVSKAVWLSLKKNAFLFNLNLFPLDYDWNKHPEDHVITAILSQQQPTHKKLIKLPNTVTKLDYYCNILTFADFQLINLHLHHNKIESTTRLDQLKFLMHCIDSNPATIIMSGDFNFDLNDINNEEYKLLISLRFNDSWRSLNGIQPGFTVNPNKNLLRLLTNSHSKPERKDGFFIRSDKTIHYESIYLTGTTPYNQGKKEYSFISDHFGVSLDVKI